MTKREGSPEVRLWTLELTRDQMRDVEALVVQRWRDECSFDALTGGGYRRHWLKINEACNRALGTSGKPVPVRTRRKTRLVGTIKKRRAA